MLYCTALFYGVFILKDVPPKPLTPEQEKAKSENKKSFLADFFDIQHVRETFHLAFKSDEKYRRRKIIMLMIIIILVIGPQHGLFTLATFLTLKSVVLTDPRPFTR